MAKRTTNDTDAVGIAAGRARSEQQRGRDPYEGKNPAAVELGRLGGQKGGKARAARLTAERRSEIAREAARARWQGREGGRG